MSTRFGRACVPTSTTTRKPPDSRASPPPRAPAAGRCSPRAPARPGASSATMLRNATTRARCASTRTFHSSFCSGRKKRSDPVGQGQLTFRRACAKPPAAASGSRSERPRWKSPELLPHSCGWAPRTVSSSANPVPSYVTERQPAGSTPLTRRNRSAISSARALPVRSSTSGFTPSPGRNSEEARTSATAPIPASARGDSGRTGGTASGTRSARGGAGTNPASPLGRPSPAGNRRGAYTARGRRPEAGAGSAR